MSWMNLEPVKQSEVSQKEKDKYRILTHIYGIQKNGTKDLFLGQQWRNRHREQNYGHGEKRGQGEIYGKSNMQLCITICKIHSQQEFAVWLRKLKQELCINLEGQDGEEDGREVQEAGDIGIPMADSC